MRTTLAVAAIALAGLLATMGSAQAQVVKQTPPDEAPPPSSELDQGSTTTYELVGTVLPDGTVEPVGAEVAAAAAGNPAGCSLNALDPRLDWGDIEGEAFQVCDFAVSQYIDVYLDQYRGLGFWRKKAEKHPNGFTDLLSGTATWQNCFGSGSQLYRTRAYGGYEFSGQLYRSNGVVNEKRLDCGQ